MPQNKVMSGQVFAQWLVWWGGWVQCVCWHPQNIISKKLNTMDLQVVQLLTDTNYTKNVNPLQSQNNTMANTCTIPQPGSQTTVLVSMGTQVRPRGPIFHCGPRPRAVLGTRPPKQCPQVCFQTFQTCFPEKKTCLKKQSPPEDKLLAHHHYQNIELTFHKMLPFLFPFREQILPASWHSTKSPTTR